MREVSLEEQADNAQNLTFGDDRLGVLFYLRTVEDHERTLREGRKCFKEKEFIKILIPGDHTNVVDRPIQKTGVLPSDDVMRFPQQWARFKNQQEQVVHDGMPLTLWPQMPTPMAEELKYLNVFTVEQLAELSDTFVSKMPQGHQWKKMAADFVKALNDQQAVTKLQTALQERDNRIDTLEEAIRDQAARIEELMAKLK